MFYTNVAEINRKSIRGSVKTPKIGAFHFYACNDPTIFLLCKLFFFLIQLLCIFQTEGSPDGDETRMMNSTQLDDDAESRVWRACW